MNWGSYLLGLATLPTITALVYVFAVLFAPSPVTTECTFCGGFSRTAKRGISRPSTHVAWWLHSHRHHRQEQRQWQRLHTRKDHWWSRRVYDPTASARATDEDSPRQVAA